LRPFSLLLLAVALPAVALAALGCARCSGPDGPAPSVSGASLLPPPKPWSFSLVRVRPDIAYPQGCQRRGPVVRADVPPTTRFVADPHTLATLVVADSTGEPPELTGVAAVTLDPAGATRLPIPIPWTSAALFPHLARTPAGAWIAALAVPDDAGLPHAGLWRSGVVEPFPSAFRLEAADLLCSGEVCALLAGRADVHALAGADVFLGSPESPIARWRHTAINAPGDSDARPLSLSGTGVAVLLEGNDCVFWTTDEPPHEIARVPVPHGVLDAAVVPSPVAMVYDGAVGDDGCPQQGPDGGTFTLRFQRPGLPPADVSLAAPPAIGVLRPLRRGALAVWRAPLGCHLARQVVYAVVLDGTGTPVAAPTAVANGSAFAVAADGDDVDLWVEADRAVSWARMTCSAP
jgi:hypothetical protein